MAFKISFISSVLMYLLSNALFFNNPEGINRDKYRIHISRIDEHINVDGILDEAVWQSADVAKDFHGVLPIDTGYAAAKTEVRLAYNETTIFVGVICYDPSQGKRPMNH